MLRLRSTGILAAENGRSLAYLVDQNEITAAVFALACAVTGAIVLWQNPGTHSAGCSWSSRS